jgi:Tfp pilus assembly protein PilO
MNDAVLGRRVLREHRRLVLPLAIGLAVNLAVYVLAVRPLADRVANIAQRDAAAEQALQTARREHELAIGTSTGKDRAAQELTRFYEEVLPANLAAARSLTHTRVPQISRQFDVLFYSGTVSPLTRARDSSLTRYTSKVELSGRYDDVRSFIHALETAPEFVVIDDITLSEDDVEGGQLQLTLQLSTYFQAVE